MIIPVPTKIYPAWIEASNEINLPMFQPAGKEVQPVNRSVELFEVFVIDQPGTMSPTFCPFALVSFMIENTIIQHACNSRIKDGALPVGENVYGKKHDRS